jgi:DNA-binding transcriptional LysR family regulator
MDLRQLRYIREIGRLRHFTRAAEALGVAQPALSQSVAGLERELGVALFERTSRTVRPTTAGTAFLEAAAKILADVDALRDTMTEYAGLLRGRVAAGTLQVYGELTMPRIVGAFHRVHPGVALSIAHDMTAVMLAGVRAGDLDVALVNVADFSLHPDLAFIRIEDDRLAIAVPPDHRLAHREQVAFPELCDEPFVSFRPGSGLHATLLATAREAGFTPRIVCETGDTIALRALVSEGLGVALLSREYARAAGPPIAVLDVTPRLDRAVALAMRAGGPVNPAARAFVGFWREWNAR